MKKLYIFLLIIYTTNGCSGNNSEKINQMTLSENSNVKKELVKISSQFYKDYQPFLTSDQSYFERFIKNNSYYFSVNLTKILLEEVSCREEGYVCNLDSDPFYNSQDKISAISFNYLNGKSVEAEFSDKSKITLVFNCSDKCVISNFVYSDGTDLMTKLQQQD